MCADLQTPGGPGDWSRSSYAVGLVVLTGALVLINGDPEDPPVVGLWVWTGALVLTSVPDPPELPLAVPLPVVPMGTLVLTNGDPDVPGAPAEPLLALPAPPVVAGAELWLFPFGTDGGFPAGAPPEDSA